MSWRRRKKRESDREDEIADRIKNEIRSELGNKGVAVSGIKMQINANDISLSIYIRESKRMAI